MAVRDLTLGHTVGVRWNDTNRTVTAIYADPPPVGRARVIIGVGGEQFEVARDRTATRGTVTLPTRVRSFLTVLRDEKDRFDYIDGYDWLTVEVEFD